LFLSFFICLAISFFLYFLFAIKLFQLILVRNRLWKIQTHQIRWNHQFQWYTVFPNLSSQIRYIFFLKNVFHNLKIYYNVDRQKFPQNFNNPDVFTTYFASQLYEISFSQV